MVTGADGNIAASNDGTLEGIAIQYGTNFEANVLTAVLLTEALIPHLPRPGGRIVHLSSVASLRSPGSYGGAKANINVYTHELAKRLSAEGITVAQVAGRAVPGQFAELVTDP